MAEENVILTNDDIEDIYDWIVPPEVMKMEIERAEREREAAAKEDSFNKRKREEITEEDSSNKRIDFRFESDDDEYDWTDLFEMEKMEMERQREEAAEKDSSNKRIDWMDPFDVEKLEMEIKKRQREEAAKEDSPFFPPFESEDDYWNWMDPVEVEKWDMEREEIEERERDEADEEDSNDRIVTHRFEISEMQEFIQKKRERRTKENLQTSVVQFVKHQEIGLKKLCTNSLRKFLLNQEIRVDGNIRNIRNYLFDRNLDSSYE